MGDPPGETVKEQDEELVDEATEFWKLIERTIGCTVPLYLKNLLKSQGFDNVLAMKNIDQDDIEFLEEFARTKADDLANFGESEEDDPDVQIDLHTLSSITGELMVKDYSNKFFDNDCLDESSIFVAVNYSSGKRKVVRKSTICWLLMEDKHKLSNDRLSRVKDADNKSKQNSLAVHSASSESCFLICKEISVGQWCLLRNKNSILVSLGLEFAKVNGTKKSTLNHPQRSCDIKKAKDTNNPIGALCSHFSVKALGRLEEFEHPFYLTVDKYKGTLHSKMV